MAAGTGGGAAPSLPHALAMLVAGFGWGIYSLAGKLSTVPMVSSAANFVLTAGLGCLVQIGLFAMGGGGGGRKLVRPARCCWRCFRAP